MNTGILLIPLNLIFSFSLYSFYKSFNKMTWYTQQVQATRDFLRRRIFENEENVKKEVIDYFSQTKKSIYKFGIWGIVVLASMYLLGYVHFINGYTWVFNNIFIVQVISTLFMLYVGFMFYVATRLKQKTLSKFSN